MSAQLATALAAYQENVGTQSKENEASTSNNITGGEQVDNGGELLEAQGRFTEGRRRIQQRLQCWSRRRC
jgi:hypothetical protein